MNAGAIPVLAGLLNSPDADVQYHCATALSNIAVDSKNTIPFDSRLDAHLMLGVNRKKLAQSEPRLVQDLVQLMDSPSFKIQCQAALALRNLAVDGKS